MDEELEVLAVEKMKIVLNLIRTNSTEDAVLKITQGYRNLVDGENARKQGSKPTRKQGAGAS